MCVRALGFAMALALAGCASMPPASGARVNRRWVAALGTPAGPVAAGHIEVTIPARDGTALYVQRWKPDAPPRAALVIVHGLRDHSGRYARLAKELAKRGFVVVAADLRGHGRSGGPRVYVDRFDRYVADLRVVVAAARAAAPDVPLFVMGHSMGGVVAARFAEQRGARIDGLVLSAPAFASYVSVPERCGANLLADLDPFSPRLEIAMSKWSRDPRVVRDNLADPLVVQRGGPVSTAVALLDAADAALEEAPFVHVPTLVLHGEADGITDPAGSAAFVGRIRAGDKTLALYPKLFHDLWNEPEKEQLTSDLARWLEAHAPLPGVELDDDDADEDEAGAEGDDE